jgi:lipoprotein NlpI
MFKQIEGIVNKDETSVLCNMNRGYLSLAMDQYNTAVENFQAVLNVDSNNIVAANNKAICLLYKCDMTGATNMLEEIIRRDPERNLNETIVFNLCTLYDLKSDNSTEKKKSIMNLVAKFGSDSFDFSVLKLTS